MNRDDVTRMAREVGLEQDGDNFFSPKSDPQVDVHITDLEAFAALVASAEREACAIVCEEIYTGEEASCDWPTPEMCATAIRARGQA